MTCQKQHNSVGPVVPTASRTTRRGAASSSRLRRDVTSRPGHAQRYEGAEQAGSVAWRGYLGVALCVIGFAIGVACLIFIPERHGL